MKRRPRIKPLLLVLLMVVMINLPLVHSSWVNWRVERSGIDVTATVTGGGSVPAAEQPEYLVSFRFDKDIDPQQTEWNAEVDEATAQRAVDSKEIRVRVLRGQPAAYTAEGEVTHRFGLVATLLADLALLLVLLLFWRFRGTLRAPLVAVAIGDVTRCAPESLLERVEGDLYLIRGEVSVIEDGRITLDLGDRQVQVQLDGHANPVGYQQPAEVRGRLIG
ncbi:hypothetical protein H5V45_11275 [Nocardioides sp. KIGAM211]|uniref:Uncharacterized protein n=1 Tax=Nocardioides luti TaxID=2761101 RepID=A0A7X0VAL5_9ACTN|nr:hypothetical protein [Nocardioides luti]MBB6627899.1 hypothetical protein [Nocardioides luti]